MHLGLPKTPGFNFPTKNKLVKKHCKSIVNSDSHMNTHEEQRRAMDKDDGQPDVS